MEREPAPNVEYLLTAIAMKTQRGKKRDAEVKDVALVVGQTEDRKGYQILRRRGENADIELGTVRPLEAGKPIDGEVVGMRRRDEHPLLFDVKTEFDTRSLPDGPRGTSVGPAQVASDKYREGWEAIWGSEPADAKLN